MFGRYLRPGGRLARLEFLRSTAIVLIGVEAGVPVCLIVFGLGAGFFPSEPPFEAIGSTFLAIFALGTWSIAVLSAQRLHDRDHSGWWALLVLVPLGGLVWTLAWNGARRGTPGPNRFGVDPRGGAIAEVFDDGNKPTRPRRPPVASTILAWLVLSVATLAMAVMLFQKPSGRPVHKGLSRSSSTDQGAPVEIGFAARHVT